MKKILLIHGPNLNRLGRRDPKHYGTITLPELEACVREAAQKKGYELEAFQSNHEGALIDWIQEKSDSAAGILINPGALTHSSYALHDALLDTGLPCVELHLSDLSQREDWRQKSVTAPACMAVRQGKGKDSYLEGLELLTTPLNAVIGFPLGHSQSPAFHSAQYRERGINAVMLAWANPDVRVLVQVIRDYKIGLTAVTLPHKESILPLLDHVDELAKRIGAVNTVLQIHGKLHGFNTDYLGLKTALSTVDLKGKTVLLLGAGGAARPLAALVSDSGGHLFCLNRSHEKAQALVEEFGGRAITESDLDGLSPNIIVNTTPLGMHPKEDETPLDSRHFKPGQSVLDIVYNPEETRFLREAKVAGAFTISGKIMFEAQALEQIQLWENNVLSTNS